MNDSDLVTKRLDDMTVKKTLQPATLTAAGCLWLPRSWVPGCRLSGAAKAMPHTRRRRAAAGENSERRQEQGQQQQQQQPSPKKTRRRSARGQEGQGRDTGVADAGRGRARGVRALGGNELLTLHRRCSAAFPPDMARLLDPALPGGEERREELYALFDDAMGQAIRYAWAVPDERALRVMCAIGACVVASTPHTSCNVRLSGRCARPCHVRASERGGVVGGLHAHAGRPMVEVGCGNGYWARLLRDAGVDILPYDHRLPPPAARWTELQVGGPEVLEAHTARVLFLCYPDDFEDSDESMAARCLRHYRGDTVVHVGELLGDTCALPSPWGRTTGSEAQLHLHTAYHKVLQVPLQRWPFSRDALSVWRRTSTIIFDGAMYAHVPELERLAMPDGVVAPDFARLLR
jgi:hypothetical protein